MGICLLAQGQNGIDMNYGAQRSTYFLMHGEGFPFADELGVEFFDFGIVGGDGLLSTEHQFVHHFHVLDLLARVRLKFPDPGRDGRHDKGGVK